MAQDTTDIQLTTISLKRPITLTAYDRGDTEQTSDVRAVCLFALPLSNLSFNAYFAGDKDGNRHLVAEPTHGFFTFYGERMEPRDKARASYLASANLTPVMVTLNESIIDAITA